MEHGVEVTGAISFVSIDPFTVLCLLALGFMGGMLSGFVGSGGAFVLTPGMMNLGVPGPIAVASNMCHKFPKALVGAWKRRKLGHVDVRLGLVMGASSVVGVKLGVSVQNAILSAWGASGSNLYISATFVVVLFSVGFTMLRDARRAVLRGTDDTVPGLARWVSRLNIPPMISFPTAKSKVSLWVTVPLGLATGMLAATIAVGGFIGVPAMIYVVGAPAFVASGTELLVAFTMGMVGTYEYAMSGLVDLRLSVLILAGSLVGVQLGAVGTTYVKQYMIKFITAFIMLLAGVSRALMIPTYLADAGVISLESQIHGLLAFLSAAVLYGTLVTSALLIIGVMVRGKREADRREAEAAVRLDPAASAAGSGAGK